MVKHITDSLDSIESRKHMPEKLLNTIRVPLNLGMITDRMPASNYQSSERKIEAISPEQSKLSAMHKLKPMKDVEVRDSKDSLSRVSSADNESRATPVSIKEQVAKKRYVSSQEGQRPISSASTPELIKEKVEESKDFQKAARAPPVKLINPDMGVIEEKEDDGTGMENVKALLKDRKNTVENPLVVEKQKMPNLKEVPPRSEDVLQRKKNILLREDIISKQVERLASLQQRYADQHEKQRSEKIISLPVIKPRHIVHQSVDNIKVSQPLLGRLQNQIVNLSSDKSVEKVQINNLVNLRYKNRAIEEDAQSALSNPVS